jgi:hypothetical protein
LGSGRNYNKEVMPLPLARYATTYERGRRSRADVEAHVLLRWWHLASLDAPTVAVLWSLSFARTARVNLPFWVPVLVALGTWCVYVGDRVLDARRALDSGKLESLRERHFFHWRHRRVMIPLSACAALAAAAIIVRQMPATVREHDSVLALAALAYFSGVHAPGARRPKWLSRLQSKELAVGVLFTAGCALPTLTRLHAVPGGGVSAILLAMGFYAALAWLNCAAIDRWESGDSSRVALPAGLIAAGAGLLALACAWFDPRLSLLCAACAGSALLLAWLDRQRGRLTPLALRCAADLVLLTPIVCWMR